MGRYSFSHGHQLEHPQKMGEDSKWCVVAVDVFLDRMARRLSCIWQRDRHQPVDTSRWWTGWLPWLITHLECGSKTTGVWNGYTPLCVKFFDEELSSTLMQNTPAQSLRDLSLWHWTKPTRQRHEGVPMQNRGKAQVDWTEPQMECPHSTHWTEILCTILIFISCHRLGEN